MFHLDLDDDPADEPRSDAAWAMARRIVAEWRIGDWPPVPEAVPAELALTVRRALTETYVYGLLYGAATQKGAVTQNGVALRVPGLVGTEGYEAAARLFSWETLLPFVDGEGDPAALAARFEGLAALCRRAVRPRR